MSRQPTMRAVSGSEHSTNLQMIKETKETTSKSRKTAASGAYAKPAPRDTAATSEETAGR